MTTTETAPEGASADLVSDEIGLLIKQAIAKVEDGKATFADVVAALLGDRIPTTDVTPRAPKVPEITDEQRKALTLLTEVYGRVAPKTPRLLTESEQAALIEERQVVDTILTFLTKRKNEGIREIIANHLDKAAERDGVAEGAERDDKGHYLLAQEQEVPGTGKKMCRIIAEGKPQVDSILLADAYERGDLTREEYLALTEVPPVKRVFSEEKARKAIKKNPALLFKLASVVRPGRKIATIKANPA